MTEGPDQILEHVRSGRASGELRRRLVRGLVHLDTFRLIQCLALLSLDRDSSVRSPARQMLGAMLRSDVIDACSLLEMPGDILDIMARFFPRDEGILEEILHHPAVSRETVSFIATLPLPGPLEIIALRHPWTDPFPAILAMLRAGGSTPPEVIMEWQKRHEFLLEIRKRETLRETEEERSLHPSLLHDAGDTAAEAAGEPPAEEQKRDSVMGRIGSMSAGLKVALALKGNSAVRRILITDKNRAVATKVLENPGITESEVVFYARLTTLSRDVLRIIGTNREWLKNRSVVRSLVANPKTPLGISMRHVSGLNLTELKGLTANRNIPAALRSAASTILRHRLENR